MIFYSIKRSVWTGLFANWAIWNPSLIRHAQMWTLLKMKMTNRFAFKWKICINDTFWARTAAWISSNSWAQWLIRIQSWRVCSIEWTRSRTCRKEWPLSRMKTNSWEKTLNTFRQIQLEIVIVKLVLSENWINQTKEENFELKKKKKRHYLCVDICVQH